MAALVVIAGTIAFLSENLPENPQETFHFPATDFNFVFGSGSPTDKLMLVNEFVNGYALLTSGPVSIKAEEHRVLAYTWLPPGIPGDAAFFWKRSDDLQNVVRTEITAPGSQLIDLSTEPDWNGEITEFGFLIAGVSDETIGIGEVQLIPDNLNIRLRLTWGAWAAFEEWSQQSINFLYGGNYRQVTALPLLIAAWLALTLLFLWILKRIGKGVDSRQLLASAGLLFLIAWMLLDTRWAANNLRQIHLSLTNNWQTDEQQRLGNDLDGEIYQYAQRLKSSVLGDQNVRILIIGDDTATGYYLLRAKYHLLPHSVNVAGYLVKELAPGSLDFVIFFGQPNGIIKVPGWNRGWQDALARIDSGKWGAVYRIKQQ